MSGAVIKAGDSRISTRGMVGMDLRDISEQARAMLGAAETEARRIVLEANDRARRDSEALRRDSARRGYEEGLARGAGEGKDQALAEARKKLIADQAALIAALNDLVAKFGAAREEFLVAARRDVIVLALAIARRITAGPAKLEFQPGETAAAACAEALALIGPASEASVRVHPEDAKALESLCHPIKATMNASRCVRLVEDDSLPRGGVRVEAVDTEIDATVCSRVERIADELLADWRQRMQQLRLES